MHLPDEVGQIATGGGGIARLDRLEGRSQLGVQAGLQALFEVEAVDHVDHDRQAVGGGHLKGSDVARGPLGSAHPALVGGRATAAHRDLVDGRAVGLQGQGLSRPTIVLQAARIELGVGVLQIACAGEAAVGAAFQVVARREGVPDAVAPRVVRHDASANPHPGARVVDAADKGGRVAGKGAVADGEHAEGLVEEAAAAPAGGVAGKGAVADGDRAAELVEEAAALGAGRVVGEGAVADAHRAAHVEEAAAGAGGRVVGKGAVADAHRAADVGEAATVVGQAMGNGEGVEREADAAIHGEHLHAVATIEGDALPAAVQGQVLADGERADDGDGATTTERDRVPSGGAADDGADAPRAGLPTTIGDGQGRSGSRMRVQAHSGHHDAEDAQQTQQDHQEQTRGPIH